MTKRGAVTSSGARIPGCNLSDLSDEQMDILVKCNWKGGSEPAQDPWYRVIIRHPKLFRRWITFASLLLQRGDIPPRHREILILRVAWRCQSPSLFGYHVHIAHNGLPTESPIGCSEADINHIVAGPDDPAWDPFERALVRSVDELLTSHNVSDSTWSTLSEQYTERQLIELPFLVGQYQMVCYSQNSLGIGPDGTGGLAAR